MVDKIIQGKTRTRREFCSFYTESDPILTYMVKRLDVVNGDMILEPCVGDGDFIQKILSLNKDKNFQVEALDINPLAIQHLRDKFDNKRVNIREADTLLDPTLDLLSNSGGYYTKIIGNPPYGAWQGYKKRNILKRLYGGYVRETYTLFLRRCIDLLKEGGRLAFIIPDTFLALHLHKDTRKALLENTKIEEILLIPSNFFPGVNFGYSNLCIISFVKKRDGKKHKVRIMSVKDKIEDLYKIADGDYSVATGLEVIFQGDILRSVDYSFLIGGNTKIRNLVNKSKTKLGDVADCVTGFYSGDNKAFLVARGATIKGARGYSTVDLSLVDPGFLNRPNLLDGLKNGKIYIPVLKGGKSAFKKPTEWFIKWDAKTVAFYKKSKASRFQNSQYYFKQGIGVPMVKTNQIYAFLLERRLFDQSIVGVFPREKRYMNYLLAFLNSRACSKILKVINHTANNSANYLKKLPIIFDMGILGTIDKIMENISEEKDTKKSLDDINKIFSNLYQISL